MAAETVDVVWTQAHGGTSTFRAAGTPRELVAWLKQLAADLEKQCR